MILLNAEMLLAWPKVLRARSRLGVMLLQPRRTRNQIPCRADPSLRGHCKCYAAAARRVEQVEQPVVKLLPLRRWRPRTAVHRLRWLHRRTVLVIPQQLDHWLCVLAADGERLQRNCCYSSPSVLPLVATLNEM